MALDKQTIGVTLVDGLDTKNDQRTLVPGKLTSVSNLSLSEQGTLARVDPSLLLASQSGLDALYTRKSELLGTVSRNLYAYEARTKTAIDHGRMSGVVARTERLFTLGAEQSGGYRYQDCDHLDVAFYKASSQAAGLACYVWTENGIDSGGSGVANKGYVRLVDQATGTTILGPTALSSSLGVLGTRVVATSNAFLIFWYEAPAAVTLYCSVIQYTAPTTVGTATSLRTDISADPCLDVFTSAFNASANAFAVYTSNDATYSVRAIKVTQAAGVPSVSAGPTDVETVANATAAQVSSVAIANCANTPLYGVAILAASAAARPGLITAVLDDSCAISSAAAQKDSAAGPDITRGKRAAVAICPGNGSFQVLSDRREECGNTAAVYNIRTTTLSSVNAITAGPAIAFYGAARADGTNGPYLAGKPYLFNSRYYVPLEFTAARSTGSQLQNTWFLADVANGAYIARCLYGGAGPERAAAAPITLPSVVALAYNGENYVDHLTATRQLIPSGLDWTTAFTPICGMTRVTIRTHYSTVLPETHPQWAECAETSFFGDAVGSAYAGPLPSPALPSTATKTNAAEASFLLFPESITVANSAVAVNPLSAVARRFSAVYEWYDGAGQRHQSAPAVEVAFTPDGVNQTTVTVPMLHATLMRQRCSIVLYMSESSTGVLKRLSQPGSAAYMQINDFASATLSVNIQSTMTLGEPLYTEDGTLDNDGPRPMSTLCVHQGRILADVTDDPYKWQISQAPVTGYGLQWSVDLGGEVDPQKGRIVAVASMDGRGILFRERGITVLNGLAPLPDGTGGSMSPEDLATDVGCMWPHSVCAFSGGVLFKSAKGWHVLDRSLNVVYVGEGPAQYDAAVSGSRVLDAASNAVYSAALSDTRKEIRVVGVTTGNSRASFLYNYEHGRWTTGDSSALGATWWPANFKFVASTGNSPGNITGAMATAASGFAVDLPLKYLNGAIVPGGADSGYSPLTASFTTGWLKPSEAIQGYQRVWWVELAGGVADGSTTPGSTLTVTLEMITPDGTTSQTYAFTTNNLIASGQNTWQARCKPTVQKCQAIRVTASDVPTGAGGGVNFSGLTLVVGVKQGAGRLAAAKTL